MAISSLRLYAFMKSDNFTPHQCVTWLQPSIHLKSNMISDLGSFLMSSSFKVTVSPFAFITCSAQVPGSKSFPKPRLPFTLTFFAAADKEYDLALWAFDIQLLKNF